MATKLFLTCAVIGLSLANAGAQVAQNGVGSPFELAFWQSVSESQDAAQYEAYLAQYPSGTFSALARAKIAALHRSESLTRGTAPPAPPVAPVPVAPAPPSPPAQTPVAQPAVPVTAQSLADHLGALGQSQGVRSTGASSPAMTPAAEPLPSLPVLPPEPVLKTVPPVDLPPRFCSAADRNAFHQSVYIPAKALADENNDITIAHLNALQAAYDGYAKAGDHATMNMVAAAAKSYSVVANAAHDLSVRYKDVYSQLMAVPIAKCPGG